LKQVTLFSVKGKKNPLFIPIAWTFTGISDSTWWSQTRR